VVVVFGGGLAVTVRTFDITFTAFFIKPPAFINDDISIDVLNDFHLISHDFHLLLRQGFLVCHTRDTTTQISVQGQFSGNNRKIRLKVR